MTLTVCNLHLKYSFHVSGGKIQCQHPSGFHHRGMQGLFLSDDLVFQVQVYCKDTEKSPENMADEHECHKNDEIIVPEILERRYVPACLKSVAWEGFNFAGHEIKIVESTDLYGATVWPSALVLCYFLEKQGKQLCIEDKSIIEIGSGTGLVAVVASLLGARVVATDLEELIGNLQFNIVRNTKMKSKHLPQVKELIWGSNLEKKFPKSSLHFDYIFAADVVYNHPYLEELLETFDHLCSENTTILWVMKFRKENTLLENVFIQKFQKQFDMEVIYDLPSLSIKLFKAKRCNRQT